MWAAQHEAPIYSRLIQERGDIPAQVRAVAEQTLRDLERVMPAPLPRSMPTQAPQSQAPALNSGGQGSL
ncbi:MULTISPECIES: hypothetical protein [unclassified Streptomyces]|uniref:hypothetical protein n=1 Tax=unclassified Streptomyces TaxID=2593676 RepID=UPI00343DC844